MQLTSGASLKQYVITAPLGKGGMGEVYRARDGSLGREVAIKVLPAEVARDPERLARFQREAQLLAALHHPRLASIFGLEADGEIPFLVMELVEGEDLATRLRRGPVPIEEVLEIGAQLAEALEAAHERGIVHRDLKPANVMLTPDGRVKVLDFGLAKAWDEPGATVSSPEITNSPTMARGISQSGVILGTAAYMSPEQARGKPVDKRSDVWSFGVVLFEMLSGARPFHGETVSDTLAAVLREEIDWSVLPEETPPRLRGLLRRCLDRNPSTRLRDIGEARIVLQHGDDFAPMERTKGRHTYRGLWTAVPWIGLAAALGIAALGWSRRPVTNAPPAAVPAAFSIELPPASEPESYTAPVISPDGRWLAFALRTIEGRKLVIRDLRSFEARVLPETLKSWAFTFSPDSEWLAYVNSRGIRRIPVSGGKAVSTFPLPFWVSNVAWTSGGWFVLSRGQFSSPETRGLWGVSVDGSGGRELKRLTTPDASKGEFQHLAPLALPDGRVLFVIEQASGSTLAAISPETGKVERFDIAGGPPRALLPTGDLVFVDQGRLVAAPLDLEAGKLTGPRRPVLAEVMDGVAGISPAGVVTYFHYPKGAPQRTFVRVDRSGVVSPLYDKSESFRWPRLSPDGKRLAFGEAASGDSDIEVVDLETGARVVLRDPGSNSEPVWTRDGKRVIYSSYGSGTKGADLHWQLADGSGSSEPLSALPGDQWPTDTSPDGALVLAYVDGASGEEPGIWSARLDGGGARRIIAERGAALRCPRLSPDGKWLAYASMESGRWEIYVQPFDVAGPRVPVSNDGGESPAWSPDGRELFYRTGAAMMAVDVRTSPTFSVSAPRKLFEGLFWSDPYGDLDYDVTPDGRAFVMAKGTPGAEPQLRVATGWTGR